MKDRNDCNPDYMLLGAHLDTGNMGVNALLVSTVKCILHLHPEAKISLLEGIPNPGPNEIPLSNGKIFKLDCVGVRRNKFVWQKNHLLRLLFTAVCIRTLPFKKAREHLFNNNPYLAAIRNAKVVADITGGDSFSDIYGLPRLIFGTMNKALIILSGQKLVLLPQTYGPFKSGLARAMARWVLSRSSAIYSRDQEGLSAIERLMKGKKMRAKPIFSYDMAFILEPVPPRELCLIPPAGPDKNGKCLIGFNVSGLLYHKEEREKNPFGLSMDYRGLIHDIMKELLADERNQILFIPHVFGRADGFEDDPKACAHIMDIFSGQFPSRLFRLDGRYTESELKHIIGGCDFFIGSRMHACIAAISQGIPAVPLAYSNKFIGVFESLGVADSVMDLASTDSSTICKKILAALEQRTSLAAKLAKSMPKVQASVLALVQDVFKDE